MTPRLLDLFCGAGGCSVGYSRAGFEVVGVDIKLMPHYPFEFHQADALEYCAAHGREFDVIHASPPCQFYSECTPNTHKDNHPDLIGETRKCLSAIAKPYIIENVDGARFELDNPIMLCGSMFSLPIFRHRWFEIFPVFFALLPSCRHDFIPIKVSGRGMRKINGKRNGAAPVSMRRSAMDIDWMTGNELTEAIPPAYTEWIGKQLIERIFPC